ncbi:MAG: response regulator transcription factor [Actinobacteria bacterium]|nr:response regulator transcription factor [Actinomycetota bacterium]
MPAILLATDADWIADEVEAALGEMDTSIRRVRRGEHVLPAVHDVEPDLVILDLQIGNMGGMATCMTLRLEEGAGRLPHLPVIMLLDRSADLFLAQRSDADGWLVKPIDSIRLRRAADAVLAGGRWTEGLGESEHMGAADLGEAV